MAYGPSVPLYDEEVWTAILETWDKFPSAFTRGCGQITMSHRVREASRRYYSPRRIRRVLMAATHAGRARGVHNHDGVHRCYTILSRAPLGEPPQFAVECNSKGDWELVERHAVWDLSGRLCGSVISRRRYPAEAPARRDATRLASQMRGGS